MSARKQVVLTTSANVQPAASSTAWRLRSACSAWASTPSASWPVAGSAPSWPGAEHEVVGRDRLAVRPDRRAARRSCSRLDGSSRPPPQSAVDGRRGDERRARPRGSRGDRRPAPRERARRPPPRRRAKDRAPTGSGPSPTARSGRRRSRVSARRSGAEAGREQVGGVGQVVRHGEHAGAPDEVVGTHRRVAGTELGGEVLRGQPRRAAVRGRGGRVGVERGERRRRRDLRRPASRGARPAARRRAG